MRVLINYAHNNSYRTIKQATTTLQAAITSEMGNSMSRRYITATKRGGEETDERVQGQPSEFFVQKSQGKPNSAFQQARPILRYFCSFIQQFRFQLKTHSP